MLNADWPSCRWDNAPIGWDLCLATHLHSHGAALGTSQGNGTSQNFATNLRSGGTIWQRRWQRQRRRRSLHFHFPGLMREGSAFSSPREEMEVGCTTFPPSPNFPSAFSFQFHCCAPPSLPRMAWRTCLCVCAPRPIHHARGLPAVHGCAASCNHLHL